MIHGKQHRPGRRARNVWVVPSGRKFVVVYEGTARPITKELTQREAIVIARKLAQRGHSELVVLGRNGRIRFRDSHGHDPFPPRG